MINIIFLLLPLIILMAGGLVAHVYSSFFRMSFYDSIANTWITMSLLSWLSIEILSVFHIWNRKTVFVFWFLICIGILIYDIKRNKSRDIYFIKDIKLMFTEHKIFMCIYFVFVFIIFVFALIRQQSNIDSMIYHLPRIMHWIQNESVNYYAAGEWRQITYPSLSEYLVGQILVLSECSRQANLVQTFAYLLSGVMICGICKKTNVKKVCAFSAMWIYYFIPMAMGQAFSTQTDDIAGMYLLVFVYYALDYIQEKQICFSKNSILKTSRLSACVILGYLCKPTISFSILIFSIWLFISITKSFNVKNWAIHIGIAIITVAIIGGPKVIRAYDFQRDYNSYVKEQTEIGVDSNESPGKKAGTSQALAPDSDSVIYGIKNPCYFISCAIRNTARLSFSAYFQEWNQIIVDKIKGIGELLHQDHARFEAQEGENYWYYDTASAPALLFLFVISLLFIIFRLSKINYEQRGFVICSILGFLLQVGLMGYTPFRTRYLVGVMAIMTITIAIVLSNIRFDTKYIYACSAASIAICVFGGIKTLSLEIDKSLYGLEAGKTHSYFLDYEPNSVSYAPIIEVINSRQFRYVAINNSSGFEYVFWATISNLKRLECVNLLNDYKIYEDLEYVPDCIVVDYYSDDDGEVLECHGIDYQLLCEYGDEGHKTALFIEEKAE